MDDVPKGKMVRLDPFDGRCCSIPGNVNFGRSHRQVLRFVVTLPSDFPKQFSRAYCSCCNRIWWKDAVWWTDASLGGAPFTLVREDGSDLPCVEEA